jgi:hypothetical protein
MVVGEQTNNSPKSLYTYKSALAILLVSDVKQTAFIMLSSKYSLVF